MATFEELALLAQHDNALRNKALYAYQKVAVAVKNEATTGIPANDTLRQAFADQILGGSASLTQLTFAILVNATIASDPAVATDASIEFAANEQFPALAGVTPNQ